MDKLVDQKFEVTGMTCSVCANHVEKAGITAPIQPPPSTYY